MKMQYQLGSLQAIPQLEDRTDEQLISESKHRAAARAILGARAAERYDAKAARGYFNEALAGCHPRERPALRQMMNASLALAERRPDDLKQAVEKLGQAPPSSRQLLMLRVIVLIAIGFGLAKLVALPFGGVGTLGAILLGLVIVVAILAVLTLLGRRRQAKAAAARAAGCRSSSPPPRCGGA